MPFGEFRLPPEPRSVGIARRRLREQLAEWGLDDLEYEACQALTEIATNVVLHARTDFVVRVEWSAYVLRVCVRDYSTKLPIQRDYAAEATTGRGLTVVQTMCRSWGVERTGDGKQVWFELAVEAPAGGRRADGAQRERASGGSDEVASSAAASSLRLRDAA
jgi:anti-sigma regulatory factor (Ser/Thr protein kinase)